MKRVKIKAFIPNNQGFHNAQWEWEKNVSRHSWFRLSSKELESTKKD